MKLSTALRVRDKDVIAFVGGGGKTTAMFRLADELAAQGKRVITTTTTRIFAAQIKLAPYHLTLLPQSPLPSPGAKFSVRRGDGGEAGVRGEVVRAALALHPHILIIGDETNEGGTSPQPSGGDKALGVPPELIDELIKLDSVDAIIYEADGARMRPFKAPAAHEPVIALSTTLLVPVVGITAIGARLDEKHVHRPEIIARLTETSMGDVVTQDMIACVLVHPHGGLKSKPNASRVVALINQVENQDELDSARALARLLLEHEEFDAVAIGAVRDESKPIRETHRRLAAIITAAGAGTRMKGRVKQLLPWRGKTLIENAIAIAEQSSAHEVVIVLGAHSEEIRAHIRPTRARVAINPNWEEGHSTSIRTGLSALASYIDGAIFINADQPLLTTEIVNTILQRYRETDSPIVAPTYSGKRGSPVLFDRVHFEELKSLSGEQGGREILDHFPEQIERVEFAEARAGFDVDTLEDYESVLRFR